MSLYFTILNLRDSAKAPQIQLIHDNRAITWETKGYDRRDFNSFDVFDEINRFWKAQTPEFQESVFTIYQGIKTIMLDAVGDASKLIDQLQYPVQKLFELHPRESFTNFLLMSCSVTVPSTLDDQYTADISRVRTVDQTYIRQDYIGLVKIGFLLRMMVPIWGEFIYLNNTDTVFKEHNAAQIMHMTWLYQSPYVDKLRRYIVSNIGKECDLTLPITHGISSEEFPDWIMSSILVARLSTCDFTCNRPEVKQGDLIQMVYKAIKTKTNGLENQFGLSVLAKSTGGDPDNPDALGSAAERYMLSEDHPAGDISIQEVGARQHATIIKYLAPTLPPELYLEYMKCKTELMQKPVSVLHKQFLPWVIKDVLSSTCVPYLERDTLIGLMCLMAAILHHRGHLELAAFLTSYEYRGMDLLVNSELLAKLTPDNLTALNDPIHFPLRRRPKPGAKIAKEPNAIVIAIEELAKRITSSNFRLTLPLELRSVEQKRNHDLFNPTIGMRNLLAAVIIDFNK